LIIAFFRTNAYSFPISKGIPYLDAYYNDKEAKGFYNIDLNNAPGRASFKKAFENVMVKLRDNGTYLGVEVPNYK
jgi:hypothetical protein